MEQLTKGQQRQSLPRRYPDPNPSEIVSGFGPANQNTSSSSPFERLRLRFVQLYAAVGILHLPHLYLKALGLDFPKSPLSESQSQREYPLLHLLYVLGGVGNEAVIG